EGFIQFTPGYTFSIIGMEHDLIHPATGSDRPLFIGELDIPSAYQIQNIRDQSAVLAKNFININIESGNDVDIENVTLTNNYDVAATAIAINNASNVTLKDIDVGTELGIGDNYYPTGIKINTANTVNINNVNIHAPLGIKNAPVVGLDIENVTSDVTLSGVNIGDTAGATGNYPIGLKLNNIAATRVDNSAIYAGATENTNDTIGISCMQSGSLTINNSIIDVKTT
ncbi:unnamed protein product, partial [marine sediment metagenome]